MRRRDVLIAGAAGVALSVLGRYAAAAEADSEHRLARAIGRSRTGLRDLLSC
jgi:cation transport ATPase